MVPATSHPAFFSVSVCSTSRLICTGRAVSSRNGSKNSPFNLKCASQANERPTLIDQFATVSRLKVAKVLASVFGTWSALLKDDT